MPGPGWDCENSKRPGDGGQVYLPVAQHWQYIFLLRLQPCLTVSNTRVSFTGQGHSHVQGPSAHQNLNGPQTLGSKASVSLKMTMSCFVCSEPHSRSSCSIPRPPASRYGPYATGHTGSSPNSYISQVRCFTPGGLGFSLTR